MFKRKHDSELIPGITKESVKKEKAYKKLVLDRLLNDLPTRVSRLDTRLKVVEARLNEIEGIVPTTSDQKGLLASQKQEIHIKGWVDGVDSKQIEEVKRRGSSLV